MKRFITLALIIIGLTIGVIGCAAPSALLKQDREQVYSHKINIDSAKVKTKFLQFINEYFISAKSVIQLNDQNLITGNGVVYLGSSDPLGVIKSDMVFTLMFKYVKDSYKIKCIVKAIYYDQKRTDPIDINMAGNYKEDIKKAFDKFDRAAYDYLTNTNDKF